MTPLVMGVDPSITATGVASPLGNLCRYGGDAEAGDQRLLNIHASIRGHLYAAEVALVVIEDLPKHAHGAGLTGMAQGVVRLACLERGVPYALVVASTLKKYATGSGRADKPDMRMELYKRTGIDEKDDNKVDAWWLRHMGLDHLGAPVINLPKTHRAALDAVRWPDLHPEEP